MEHGVGSLSEATSVLESSINEPAINTLVTAALPLVPLQIVSTLEAVAVPQQTCRTGRADET